MAKKINVVDVSKRQKRNAASKSETPLQRVLKERKEQNDEMLRNMRKEIKKVVHQ